MNWFEIYIEVTYSLTGKELEDWKKDREEGIPELSEIPGVSLADDSKNRSAVAPVKYKWERGAISSKSIERLTLFSIIEDGTKILLVWPEKQVFVRYDEKFINFIFTNKVF